MIISVTGASGNNLIKLNTDHIVAITESDTATVIDTVRLSYLVRESAQQVLHLILTGDLYSDPSLRWHHKFRPTPTNSLPEISVAELRSATQRPLPARPRPLPTNKKP